MEELTRIRSERGWSQQKLADESGVNKATINQIERGRRSPNIETLGKLAEALGTELGDFFPKVQQALPFNAPTDEELQRRMLPYVRPWLLYLERYCERWETRLGAGPLSKDAFKEFGANFDDIMAAVDSLMAILRHEALDPMAGPIGLTFREALLRLSRLLRAVTEAHLGNYAGDELRQAKTRALAQRASLDKLTKARAG